VLQGHGLLIGGTVGAGKTTAMAYVAVQISECSAARQLHQQYTNAQSMWQDLADEDYTKERGADVLYIDDLGRESLGGYKDADAEGRFDRLIDERWQQERATFITTNLSPNALSNKYPRAISRLQQRGRWVFTQADDQRKG